MTTASAPLSGTLASATTTGSITINGGAFNLSLSGTWAGVVVLQRSFNAGSTWLNVQTYSANTEDTGNEPEDNVWYRLNCTTYTSGTITYRVGQPSTPYYR